ncbi:MAG: hypothetical protein CTY39_08300, partial [Hyphomicrobium sp.]
MVLRIDALHGILNACTVDCGGHDRVNSPISQFDAQFGQIPMSPILAATLTRAYDVATGAGAPEVS